MELLGKSLPDSISWLTKWNLLDTAKLTIYVLKALKDLHEYGYTHNDLKPSNVVIRPGSKIHYRLIDFSVAYKFKNRYGIKP